MLTTAEASAAILAAIPAFEIEAVPVARAAGRVLKQSVVAERDQPPFDRVTMDGIAIAFAEFDDGNRQYAMQASQAAGDPALSLESGHCIEIMTGASLPEGADCIVPVERISVTNEVANIEADYAAEQNQFIHARGSDHIEGTELLTPGACISAMDIAIISSCGLTEVDVCTAPTIRVISTGNELVPTVTNRIPV